MNFNLGAQNGANKRAYPPPNNPIYTEDFEKNKAQSLRQIDAILGAQKSQVNIADKNRVLTARQLEVILSIPELSDFYNFFFVEDNEVTWDEDLKKLTSYFGKLVLSDIDKMFTFSIVLIDYYERKVNDLLIKIGNSNDPDYLKIVGKVNFLNTYKENLAILRQNLDMFYDFNNANKAEHKHFMNLVMNGRIKSAYDYADARIREEYENYMEVYRVIYGQEVEIDQKSLTRYRIWTKQKRRIEKEFPPILYN